MGCFSYLCRECGDAVNSGSFDGEHCTIYLLKDGEVVEKMTGQYDSYGRVFDANMDSREWKTDKWGNLCDLMFNDNTGDGFAVVHTDCQCGNEWLSQSDDDPEQGWGKYKHSIKGEASHFIKGENGWQEVK